MPRVLTIERDAAPAYGDPEKVEFSASKFKTQLALWDLLVLAPVHARREVAISLFRKRLIGDGTPSSQRQFSVKSQLRQRYPR